MNNIWVTPSTGQQHVVSECYGIRVYGYVETEKRSIRFECHHKRS